VQPLLVLCEDLHWIDAETQAQLDSLIESLPTARLLLLVNYRPEYQHAWSGKTYYRQLRIDPLPPESAEEMLKALLRRTGNVRFAKTGWWCAQSYANPSQGDSTLETAAIRQNRGPSPRGRGRL
jgi:hypothetical protein